MKIKRFTALILALAVMSAVGMLAFADGATRDDYKADYSEYKAYYNDVYKPCYYSYNAALDAFAQKIKDTHFTSVEQAQRVIGFLKDLKQRRSDFFGDRTTEGKSRYVVPFYRDAMTACADAKDYDGALSNCAMLYYHVQERVDFLNGLKKEIEEFEIITETRENGLEWLAGQLNTAGTEAYNYFNGRAAGTTLDSEGYNFAPAVNAAMKEAIGLDADTECSWRIIKYKSGNYGIYWSYTLVAGLEVGTEIDAAYLNTVDGVAIEGSAAVTIKNVNVSSGVNADILTINDSAFVAD